MPHQPILYHFIGFCTTSLMLLLIFGIVKKIFTDFGCNGRVSIYNSSNLLCLIQQGSNLSWLSWVLEFTISYLISFYCYLHRDKADTSHFNDYLCFGPFRIWNRIYPPWSIWPMIISKAGAFGQVYYLEEFSGILFGQNHPLLDTVMSNMTMVGTWEIPRFLLTQNLVEAILYIPLKQIIFRDHRIANDALYVIAVSWG